jgi:hypothetical protein
MCVDQKFYRQSTRFGGLRSLNPEIQGRCSHRMKLVVWVFTLCNVIAPPAPPPSRTEVPEERTAYALRTFLRTVRHTTMHKTRKQQHFIFRIIDTRVMKRYSPTGRRNRGRPVKRLLDA